MLLSIRHLSSFTIEAEDGNIGQVYSFLFDDRTWAIRYLVVDTGKWLPGRKVLIVPSALGRPVGWLRVFPVELTREKIRQSGYRRTANLSDSRRPSFQLPTGRLTEGAAWE